MFLACYLTYKLKTICQASLFDGWESLECNGKKPLHSWECSGTFSIELLENGTF